MTIKGSYDPLKGALAGDSTALAIVSSAPV